jgi:hypothetical protein
MFAPPTAGRYLGPTDYSTVDTDIRSTVTHCSGDAPGNCSATSAARVASAALGGTNPRGTKVTTIWPCHSPQSCNPRTTLVMSKSCLPPPVLGVGVDREQVDHADEVIVPVLWFHALRQVGVNLVRNGRCRVASHSLEPKRDPWPKGTRSRCGHGVEGFHGWSRQLDGRRNGLGPKVDALAGPALAEQGDLRDQRRRRRGNGRGACRLRRTRLRVVVVAVLQAVDRVLTKDPMITSRSSPCARVPRCPSAKRRTFASFDQSRY